MKKIILMLSLISLNCFAEVKPFCTVTNIRVAKQCMDRVAKNLPEYEEPNQGMASVDKTHLVKFFKAIGLSKETIAEVENADYVGAILMHGDEHEVVYYSMKKNKRTFPVEIYSLNLVDLESMLESVIHPNDVFLGLDASDFDVYEDIEYAIKEAAINI